MAQNPHDQKGQRVFWGGCLLTIVLFAALWVVRQGSGGGTIGCSTRRDYVLNVLMVLTAGALCASIAIGYVLDGSNPKRRQRLIISALWIFVFLSIVMTSVPCLKQLLAWG